MSVEQLAVLDEGVRITELTIPHQGIADFLRSNPEGDRVMKLVQAIEIGVFCLERSSTVRDVEFLRREVDRLLTTIDGAVTRLPERLQEELVMKLGTDEGQVLAPVRTFVSQASDAVRGRIKEVRDVLEGELDPAKRTSTLGRALLELQRLLDPDRKDSVQGVLGAAVNDVAKEGGLLSRTVRSCVTEAVKPLADEVERIGKQLAGNDAAEEALLTTTHKGIPYEVEVVGELQRWGARIGVQVHHVGSDNRPGDVVLVFGSLGSPEWRLVVEARDRSSRLGRKVVTETVEAAMAQRDASAAVYVSKTDEGFAREIGEWAEGECERGPFVAATHRDLLVAIRWLMVKQQLRVTVEKRSVVAHAAVDALVVRIRVALKRVTSINRSLTQIRDGASSVEDEAEALRGEIRRSLAAIEDELGGGESAGPSLVA